MVNPLIWLNELKYEYSLLRVLRGQLSTFNDFPTLIELQLTNRCNAHCIMCTYPQTIQKQPYTVLADETYEDLLRQFSAEPSLKVIVLGFQSEPFLDKILIERCRRLKEVLPHVHLEVMTNGSMLMNTDLDELFASVDMLHVSINAFSPETYAQIMQGLEFNKVLEGVHRIQQNKAWRNKTYLRLIKQQANIHERRLFKKYWNNKGFRVFGYDINSRLGTLDNFDNLQVKQSAPKKLNWPFFAL